MPRDIEALVAQMTLEEKAGLCSGQDFWHTKGVSRLGIPGVMVCDGPHGLRKQDQTGDHLGLNDSIQAVCFPTACATASSFDRDLLRALGEALGDACQAEDVAVVLGPAVNIKRSPLCGRNFEYFSEDPYLAGELAAAHIHGVQSRGVGASIKHFAANNQEYHRLTCSAQIDERTLREIYLPAFETAVKREQPWTVMCSYNLINGVYASQDPWLLTALLRDEWGFEGFVMSDWGAVDDRAAALAAGLELEMPGTYGHSADAQIVRAVREGRLSEKVLDRAVARLLRIIFRYTDNRRAAVFDKDAQHALATQMARESAVLLRNRDRALPLTENARVAFIGEFAQKPRFQGGGSSHINAHRISSALDAAAGLPGVCYAPGFPADKDEANPQWVAQAVALAKESQAAVIFAGLPDIFESEGYDRQHMRLPDCQVALIRAVAAVQPRTIVVLHNGSPVEMPWAQDVSAILEMYLAGQGVGQAAVDLLFGRANPCGKLAESFPLRLADNPSYLNFPGDGDRVEYREGVFVGYRYYDAKEMAVAFPFGHGLSYTTYRYGNLRFDKQTLSATETLTVQVDVTNTGAVAGKETVQLYVADHTGAAVRPPKELKGFVKLSLAPGETKTATFTLDERAFAWYHTGLRAWRCAAGAYEVLIGASSRDIRLTGHVTLDTPPLPLRVDTNTRVETVLNHPLLAGVAQEYRDHAFPPDEREKTDVAKAAINEEMEHRTALEAPLRSARSFGQLTDEELQAGIDRFNRLLQGE
ncbi:MAG: glycoside hydrolase family 3 C-terminal domain-containing protein [Oscillospiraceae bacterium]|jgi:beta-glucosidase|nr:glycoside hydrolase family 3 C-terminal domain-containing protein [Oscillospiraceae bacterium]